MPSGFLDEDNGAILYCNDCGQQVRTNEEHDCDGSGIDPEDHGGLWGECLGYPLEVWRFEVQNNETRLGYWDWVNNQHAIAWAGRREPKC